VQTILPLLLTGVRDGWLTLSDIVRVTCAGPARVYGIARKGTLAPGSDGDLVLVDPEVREPLQLAWLQSRAGYSPYEGLATAGWPVTTVLRGQVAYAGHAPLAPPRGAPLAFA
jgi:dihydroorotase